MSEPPFQTNPSSVCIPDPLYEPVELPALELPEEDAWAEMLGRVGWQNGRLSEALKHSFPGPQQGIRLLDELDKERSRIARELHAGAGQPLAGIRLYLDLLRESAPDLNSAAIEILNRLNTLTAQAIDQVRSVSHRLHTPSWRDAPVHLALGELVRLSGLPIKMKIRLDLEKLPFEPSQQIKIAIYRCAQECVSNVARHSQASRFRMALNVKDAGVVLICEDDGVGFSSSRSGPGIGLQALDEHARSVGGWVEVSSGTLGTTVLTYLPLKEG